MRTKSEERRQAILMSAIEVFQAAGYEQASMSEIADRLGYSKATLYSYFSSKEELFYEAMQEATNTEFDSLHASLCGIDADVRKSLEDFGARAMEIVYSPRVSNVRRLLIAAAGNQHSNLARRCYELGPARTTATVAEFLGRHMDAGKLRRANPMIASLHLRGLLEAEWLDAYLYGTLGKISRKLCEETSARAVDVFLRAYNV